MEPLNQAKRSQPVNHDRQFEYLGRWVDKEGFRAFVYDQNGGQKLANSYGEYESLIAGGIWFPEVPAKPRPSPARRKVKDAASTDSQ